jgi:hypothetical protein
MLTDTHITKGKKEWWLRKTVEGSATLLSSLPPSLPSSPFLSLPLSPFLTLLFVGISLRHKIDNEQSLLGLRQLQAEAREIMKEIKWDGKHAPSFDGWDQDSEMSETFGEENGDEREEGQEGDGSGEETDEEDEWKVESEDELGD